MCRHKRPEEKRDGERETAREEEERGERERGWDGERETLDPLTPLFMFFLLPLGLPYVNWASQECCLFYLRSSLQSSDFPLFCFLGLFPALPLATTILDSLFLF